MRPVDPMANPGRRLAEARKLQRAKRRYWLRRVVLVPIPQSPDEKEAE